MPSAGISAQPPRPTPAVFWTVPAPWPLRFRLIWALNRCSLFCGAPGGGFSFSAVRRMPGPAVFRSTAWITAPPSTWPWPMRPSPGKDRGPRPALPFGQGLKMKRRSPGAKGLPERRLRPADPKKERRSPGAKGLPGRRIPPRGPARRGQGMILRPSGRGSPPAESAWWWPGMILRPSRRFAGGIPMRGSWRRGSAPRADAPMRP